MGGEEGVGRGWGLGWAGGGGEGITTSVSLLSFSHGNKGDEGISLMVVIVLLNFHEFIS
jgi:hypothetical protein